jgi:hypothetical protein
VLWGRLGEKAAVEVWMGRQEEAERRERNKGARVEGWGFLLFDAKTIRDVRPPMNGPK